MKRARLEQLLSIARTAGALNEVLANKDETVIPPFLRERVEIQRQNLEGVLNLALAEEVE